MESYGSELANDEWKDKRFRILKRDHFRCTKCGRSGTEEVVSSNGRSVGYFGTEKDWLKSDDIKEVRLYTSSDDFKNRYGYSNLTVCSLEYEPYRFLVNEADGRIILSMIRKDSKVPNSSVEFVNIITKKGKSINSYRPQCASYHIPLR